MTAAAGAGVPILMYHEIAEPAQTHSRLAVTPANFAAQLGYLRSAGFTAMTAAALSARLAGDTGPLPDRTVVLAFDDGYADFHSRAIPCLTSTASPPRCSSPPAGSRTPACGGPRPAGCSTGPS
jgi:hypothetical protein